MALTGDHSVGDPGHTTDHDLIDNLLSAHTSQIAGKAATAHGHIESDVTGLVSDLSAKAAVGHTHAESDVTGLVTDLAGKAVSNHTHLESDVSNLSTDLNGKVDKSVATAKGDVLVASASGTVTKAGVGADGTVLTADSTQTSGVRFAPVGSLSFLPLIENVNAVTTSGAAQTLPDVSSDTINRITLTANCTLSFPAAAAGKSLSLILVQDATGSRTVTWPGTVKWASGTAPTLTTTAAKADVFTFLCADGANWLGFTAGQNF